MSSRRLPLTALLLAALPLAAAGCNAEELPLIPSAWGPPICQLGAPCCEESELRCSGDPDSTLRCSCHRSWQCAGTLEACSQDAPDMPDGAGGWTCSIDIEFEQCKRPGSDVPSGDNGWTCSQQGDEVVCRRPANTPDGSGNWDCSYESGTKRCVWRRPYGPPATQPPIVGVSSGSCSGGAPDVLIVLDRSGSMAEGGAGPSKWAQARSAISAVLAAHGSVVRFGLMLFPSAQGPCSPGTVTVPAADDTGAAIGSALATFPGGGTPLSSSLANALTNLSSGDPARDKYVLLVTDGGESCGGKPVEKVRALRAAHIATYVVGFGGDVDAAQLDAMSRAGDTAQQGARGYFTASDVTTLTAALDKIVAGLCRK